MAGLPSKRRIHDEAREGTEVLTSRDGALITLTLNRPHRLNAVNLPLYEKLVAGLERAEADRAVRCVILTGSGRASAPAPT